MTIVGFRHIGLYVDDVDRSVAFYSSVLGLQEWPTDSPGPKADLRYDMMLAQLGGGKLLAHPDKKGCISLSPATTGPFDPDKPGLDHLSVTSDDLDDHERSLTAQGVKHGSPTFMANAEMTVMSIRDPSRIQLESTLAPNAPDVVHHIRLTCDSVDDSTEFYRHLGFDVFMSGPDPRLLGGVILAHQKAGLILGLRPALAAAPFVPGRIGLGRLIVDVPADEIDALAADLDTSPTIIETAGVSVARTTDPTGIPIDCVAELRQQ
ncbi:VOC family protein [Saccharopolyspora sp. K220]|uniref:VOC family protein n=1 Tax=Saccharopolyspora soli TaxID=2926618 RepID=UPI001F5878BD|nr:VOC family protein [Saccharopolyspora soli]MCI2422512.1 VOC family protein [Saccharopolyspora soli]